MSIYDFFETEGWSIVHRISIPPREKELYSIDDLNIRRPTYSYLANTYSEGIFKHQKEAIKEFTKGENVCLTTGTASGKSLLFYAAAIEQLTKQPNSKILAIYPMRSLGREQEDRWRGALAAAGLYVEVGRIDGQVTVSSRNAILKRCQVIVMTPDVLHAWALSNLSEIAVKNFIKNLTLIVVDEVHSYTGVFGSNSAFLFRRINHIVSLFGNKIKYICASATIAQPDLHLKKLFGIDFVLISSELDTSPKFAVDIEMINPPRCNDFLSEVSQLLKELTTQPASRFISFVDSRKQTELISSILARGAEDVEIDESSFSRSHLENLNILPYRAGYEEQDRELIQSRLSKKKLKGVVSTSALELGLDIPGLDIAILIGVPYSSTSFFQRIGRIGRHSNGKVLIINSGSLYDESVFRKPEELLKRPLAEGALYLENKRIQYIHALCLARPGGEHDQIATLLGHNNDADFTSDIIWHEGFINLCKNERIGEIPIDLQNMKAQAGEDPNHTFPLRDVESQFKVELRQGPEIRALGSLSYGQLLREAYPGAVYYYATYPYRVIKISVHSKLVQVRKEKRYTTAPQHIPTLVFPNLSQGNIYTAKKFENLITAECNLQIRESICGLKERRGPNEINLTYPLNSVITGIYFDQPRFTRNYFTTGVILSHPVLNKERVVPDIIAALLYESFLMAIPFERRDIDVAVDKHRVTRGEINEGSKFIAIYDKTYGSLRLTSRILEDDVLQKILIKAIELAEYQDVNETNPETFTAFHEILASVSTRPKDFSFEVDSINPSEGQIERVIMPGSKGILLNHDNQEFIVNAVFFSPMHTALCYRGKHATARPNDTSVSIIPITSLLEIPGESIIGFYDMETGEVKAVNE